MKYYHCIPEYKGQHWIIQGKSPNENNLKAILLNTTEYKGKFVKDGAFATSSWTLVKLATSSEIVHLNACIKANKYIEPETINNKIIEIW